MGSLQHPLTDQPAPNLPKLKPGAQSSEFKGKLAMQVVALIVTIVNGIRQAMDLEPIVLSAEHAALAVVVLEAIWMIWRQHNKFAEIKAQAQVSVADKNLEGLRLQAQIAERTQQPKK